CVCSCRWYAVAFFFSSRRRHTRLQGDWSSDVCSSDLAYVEIWAFRIVGTALFGGAVAQVARLLGMPSTGYYAMMKIIMLLVAVRSEERRVGKECRSRWSAYR